MPRSLRPAASAPAGFGTMVSTMQGGRFTAETVKAHSIVHCFFMYATLRRALIATEAVDIRRVLGHSEKGVPYKANGYASAFTVAPASDPPAAIDMRSEFGGQAEWPGLGA